MKKLLGIFISYLIAFAATVGIIMVWTKALLWLYAHYGIWGIVGFGVVFAALVATTIYWVLIGDD